MSNSVPLRLGRVFLVACFSALAAVPTAFAHSGSASGGAGYSPPELTGASCDVEGADGSCPQGAQLRLKGENLRAASSVVFLGGRGVKDDRSTRPVKARPHRVVVQVPSKARSGRVRVLAADEAADGPRVTLAPAAPPVETEDPVETVAADDGAFPVRAKHDYGTATNAFGGGRGHQGQDIFAKCGSPLVAALAGEVTLAKFQARAGNYVVIKADDGTGQAYMHMLAPATVAKGDRVEAGQSIGQVGETGRASGCHLHFELWTAPGWYEGGTAIDPLPALKSWDAAS